MVLDLGITLIQGYIFSRPLPVAALPPVIAKINVLPVPTSSGQTLSLQNAPAGPHAWGGI